MRPRTVSMRAAVSALNNWAMPRNFYCGAAARKIMMALPVEGTGSSVNVLFVCENNSALSIMAEAILNAVAAGRFGAFSAGCYPDGSIDAYTIEFLARHHMP